MYFYLADASATEKNRRTVDKIKSRLSELAIAGEWSEAFGVGDVGRAALTAVEQGFTTIVLVGGDSFINETVNTLAKENVAIGIIPLGRTNTIAASIGITSSLDACDILAARRLSSYSLIAAGQRFFLSGFTLTFGDDTAQDDAAGPARQLLGRFGNKLRQAGPRKAVVCRLKIDDTFSLQAPLTQMSVWNRKFDLPLSDNRLVVSLYGSDTTIDEASPLLSTLRRAAIAEDTKGLAAHFSGERLILESDDTQPLILDGRAAGKAPMVVRIADRRVRLITQRAHLHAPQPR